MEFPLTVPGVSARKVAVFRASKTGDIIRNVPTAKLGYALAHLQTVLGIVDDRMLSDDELKTLVGFVKSHFFTLTLADLSQAANLLLLDELTTRDNKPFGARDHYQNLSVAFVSNWLKAYQRYRSSAIRSVRLALPEPEPVRTKYDEYRGDLEFRMNTILPAWNEWHDRQEGQKLEFEYAYPEILRFFESEGIYQMDPARKWELYNAAKKRSEEKEQDPFKAFAGGRQDAITTRAMVWAMREIWDALRASEGFDIRQVLQVAELTNPLEFRPIIERLRSGGNTDQYGKEIIFRAIYQYEHEK